MEGPPSCALIFPCSSLALAPRACGRSQDFFLTGPAAPVPLFLRTRAGKSVKRAYLPGRGQLGTDFHSRSRLRTPARDGQYPAGWQRLQQAYNRLPHHPGSFPRVLPMGAQLTDVTSRGLICPTVRGTPMLLSWCC